MKFNLKEELARFIKNDFSDQFIKERLIKVFLGSDDFFTIVNDVINAKKEKQKEKMSACKYLLNELDYRFENAGWQSKDKKKRVYFDPAIDQGKIKDFINNN